MVLILYGVLLFNMTLQTFPFINDKSYNSELDIYFPEFANPNYIIIYMGFVDQAPSNIPDNDLVNLRNKLLSVIDKDTKIIFDGITEGIVVPLSISIHKIIKDIIDPANVYFVHGAINGNNIYELFASKYNISSKINLIAVNYWEHYTTRYTHVDAQYNIKEKEKIFVCFNRVARPHRLALFALSLEYNLLDKSFYSYLSSSSDLKGMLQFLRTFISADLYNRIKDILNKHLDKIPYKLNTEPDQNTTIVREEDLKYFNDSYFSLVTETMFFPVYRYNHILPTEEVFFSEKIFKPIRMKHPFILLGPVGSLVELRKLGYKTFNSIIDERYDGISNDEERLLAILDEVIRISKNTPAQWIEWQEKAKEIVEHNYKILASKEIKDFVFK